MPSCDQTGVPIHFHSSTTSGSASLMSLRILLRVSPRQSPSSAIRFEMSSDADWPWLAPDFFMVSSYNGVVDNEEHKPVASAHLGQAEPVEDRDKAWLSAEPVEPRVDGEVHDEWIMTGDRGLDGIERRGRVAEGRHGAGE